MRSLFLLACVVGGAQSAPVLATPPVTVNSSGVTCDLCTGVIGYAIGNSCDSALCSAVGFLGPQAATVCEVLESAASVLGLSLCDYIEKETGEGKDAQDICTDLDACATATDPLPMVAQVSTHSISIAKPASIEEPKTCGWGSDQYNIQSDSYRDWQCTWSSAPTSAAFSMGYQSVNNDNIKISYGWCPSTCTSAYRDATCTWGDEFTSNDNFDHVTGDTVDNTLFSQPVSCFQMACNNWVDSCQIKVGSITVVP